MEFSNFESNISPFMTSEKDIGLVSSKKKKKKTTMSIMNFHLLKHTEM